MNNLAFFILLTAGTAANVIISWHVSIKAGRYHGIYRFFSFESILVLALLCAPVWFVEPWKWNQLVSWALLLGPIPLPILGFRALHSADHPAGDFENTARLVTDGIYRYIRHPLYASLMLLGAGIFFKEINLLTGLAAIVNAAALIATAKTEEGEMLKKFGEEYSRYMERTTMFVPFVI